MYLFTVFDYSRDDRTTLAANSAIQTFVVADLHETENGQYHNHKINNNHVANRRR
jgi:hypothetical protein